MAELDIDKEREEFEDSLVRSYGEDATKKRTNGDYVNPTINGLWRGWLMAKRSMPVPGETEEPVAWAIVNSRSKIHKMTLTPETAELKLAKRKEEMPGMRLRVRPLVFGDIARAPRKTS